MICEKVPVFITMESAKKGRLYRKADSILHYITRTEYNWRAIQMALICIPMGPIVHQSYPVG